MREEVIAGTPNLDAAVSSSRTRDDRALSRTRVVVYVIVSFVVLTFAVLYRGRAPGQRSPSGRPNTPDMSKVVRCRCRPNTDPLTPGIRLAIGGQLSPGVDMRCHSPW
jgi:hypothetical protein